MRMDLNFLGCGSAFNPLYGNTSAYFTNKDQLYVIDGGESVFLKLYQKELNLDLMEQLSQVICQVLLH